MVPAAMTEAAIDAVVVGGSAGAIAALGEILPKLPPEFPPVLVVVHLLPTMPSLLAELFARKCEMNVREAGSFEPIERGSIYFAPSDYHMLVTRDFRCALSIAPPENFSRPAIDPLFETAALVFGDRLAGVVLTGASSDGARGAVALHAAGGRSIVQEPDTAEVDFMPRAVIKKVPSAMRLSLAGIVTELRNLSGLS